MTRSELKAQFDRMPIGPLALTGAETWYHGGAPGFDVGDYLLAPGLTGANPRGEGRNGSFETAAVYITKHRDYALSYAERYPEKAGTLYVVRPIGRIKLDYSITLLLRTVRDLSIFDPRLFDLAHCCWRARVITVVGRVWDAPADAWWRADPSRIEALEFENRKHRDFF